MMLSQAIKDIIEGKNLSEQLAFEAMNQIMEGRATDAQIAGYLIGMRVKGETVDEITGGAKSLASKCARIHPAVDFCVDPVGTGGDCTNTFNISSTSAIVAAAAGVSVAKHGNRSVSSKSGSADFYEALGINISLKPAAVQKCIEDIGFGFMFAQTFHPAMRFAAPVRKQLGVRTMFNLLGPLSNPAGAQGQVLGVYEKEIMNFAAQTLRNLGERQALIVHGGDGTDEITNTGETYITELKDGEIVDYTIVPEIFGIKRCQLSDLQGGDAKENAAISLDIFRGKKGPMRDVVVMNSAATIYVGQKAGSLAQGMLIAQQTIDSGAAMEKLEEIREFTNREELTRL